MRPKNAKKKKDWFKPKPFPHFTNRIEPKDRRDVVRIVQNHEYVAGHAFYPLLYYEIRQRKWQRKNRKIGIKKRPIAYATHLDTHIYAWYAHQMSAQYETLLKSPQTEGLSECITAYRRIERPDGRGKRNIDFACEVFNEIKRRKDCAVLAFDVKSFFPTIDHQRLKSAWCKLLGVSRLPKAESNIFKAVTQFSYVLRDDLRLDSGGFDEKRLAALRKEGFHSFFRSGEEFRQLVVENPDIRIYKNQKKKNGRHVGIPQGLPISPVLANLYMYEFDRQMLESVANKFKAFYRRYSDDIMVVCDKKDADFIVFLVRRFIRKYAGLDLAKNKTERFECYEENEMLRVKKIVAAGKKGKNSLTYLGFEFHGDKTLLRGSTLAGYHRKMRKSISAVVARSKKAAVKNGTTPIVYTRRLYRNYTHFGKRKRNYRIPAYEWLSSGDGTYHPEQYMRKKKHWGNLITYAHDASEIFDDDNDAIKKQVRRHFVLFQKYLSRSKTS